MLHISSLSIPARGRTSRLTANCLPIFSIWFENCRAQAARAAEIEGLEGKFLWLPFLRELVFGHVLFHELGPHVHYTIRPEHKEREDVADKWARKLHVNFIRKKYWYALPVIIPAAKI